MTPASPVSTLAFLRQHALLPVLAGVVLTILAPFGTAGFSLPLRALFWIGMTVTGGLGATAARVGLSRLAPALAPWAVVVGISLGATVAVSPFVLYIFAGQSVDGHLLSLFYVWVISAVISAVGYLTERAQGVPEGTNLPSRPLLMERLPPNLRDAALHAISSEDHYVRVHTDRGEHMMLMRLGDAEALAAPVTGLKPHRSWWVAEAGVEDISRRDGRTVIRLKSGAVVPVSRSGRAALKSAGWL